MRVKELHQTDATRVAELIRESVDLAYQERRANKGIMQVIKTQTSKRSNLRYRWVWFDVSVNDPNRPIAPRWTLLEKILSRRYGFGRFDSIGESKLHTYYPLDVHENAGKPAKVRLRFRNRWNCPNMKLGEPSGRAGIELPRWPFFVWHFVAWAGIRMIGKPLTKLIDQTRLIGEGDLWAIGCPLTSKDEFGELSTALNEMAAKKSRINSSASKVNRRRRWPPWTSCVMRTG